MQIESQEAKRKCKNVNQNVLMFIILYTEHTSVDYHPDITGEEDFHRIVARKLFNLLILEESKVLFYQANSHNSLIQDFVISVWKILFVDMSA